MAILPVTAETIAHIHQGAAGLLIDREIQKAVDDLLDRGAEDKKARKVCINLEFELLDDDKVNVAVAAQAKLPAGRTGLNVAQAKLPAGRTGLNVAQAKLPAGRTGLNVAQVKADGRGQQRLVYQAFAPDDPNQRTIDEALDK